MSFFEFLFKHNLKSVNIGAVRLEDNERPVTRVDEIPAEAVTKSRIVVFVSYILGMLLLISFGTMIVFAFQEKDVPVVMHDVFFATLGYFGGAFAGYMKTIDS